MRAPYSGQHPLVGSFVTEQRADLMTKGKQIFEMLMACLLSPKLRPQLRVSDPDAEAFRYREMFGPTGLLDEMELAGAVSDASQYLDGEPLLKGEKSIAVTPCDVRSLQRVLTPGTVLIEYVLTDTLLAAFVVTNTSLVVVTSPVVTPAELREKAEEFLEAIGNEKSHISGRPTESGLPHEPRLEVVREQAQWLYEVLLRPTEQMWRSPESGVTERVIIVPHGILHRLPFCALFDGTRFVSEIVPTTQCPSASIFKTLCEKRSNADSPVTYFGLANPRGQPSAWSLPDIAGCETAVLSAANELMPDCKWEDDAIRRSSDILVLRRQKASRTAFYESAPHYNIVDLETHGAGRRQLATKHSPG